jgi:hypothetical protein
MGPSGITERRQEFDEALLDGDSRWSLVQRIVQSEGFERASQLRQILLYASKLAILRPNDTLSEYEVACKILGRRPDFHPSNDNIVRAQFSHLRNKLRQYFDGVGRDEPLVLKFPKGSYLPVFLPRPALVTLPTESAEPPQDGIAKAPANSPAALPLGPVATPPTPFWRNWKVAAAVLLNAACLLAIFLFVRNPARTPALDSRPAQSAANPQANPFVQFLARFDGPVSVVMPDTSLVLIQDVLGTNISIADYVTNDFPQRQMANVQDPEKRELISSLGILRTTSVNEALIAVDVLEALKRAGVPASIRYARDLHVHDFSEGNSILIGGPNSDPWVSLFTDKTNFRHVDNAADGTDYFENLQPAAGEKPRYVNQSLGYVDVFWTQNPSQSGYVLVINGADLQANEAAARFLLHGRMPAEIAAVFNRKDLRSFELFLRGTHMAGEADSSFELVALRLR